MAKGSAISVEYIIIEEDSGSIRVCQIYDNVKGSLRKCAKEVGFAVGPKWNTQQLGKKIIDQFSDGSTAEIGEYIISHDGSGHIDTSFDLQSSCLSRLPKPRCRKCLTANRI